MKLKHKLPPFSEIDHLKLSSYELNAMRDIVLKSEKEFKSVLESNKKLCGIHHELSKDVYENFFQISLTDLDSTIEDVTFNECEIINNKYKKLSGFKNKKKLAETKDSGINEKEYNTKTLFYKQYMHIIDPIIGKFKANPTRIRLVKLNANSSITPHIDYDPSYSVRIIIPVISDENCLNIFWVKNKVETVIFEAGNAYFLNTGFKHAVVNFSKNDRYTFMISVDGINDIEHLIT